MTTELKGPVCKTCGADWFRHGGMDHEFETAPSTPAGANTIDPSWGPEADRQWAYEYAQREDYCEPDVDLAICAGMKHARADQREQDARVCDEVANSEHRTVGERALAKVLAARIRGGGR